MKLSRSTLLLLLLLILALLPAIWLRRASADFAQESKTSHHASSPILKLTGPGPKGGPLKAEVTIHATKVVGRESNTK